MSLVSKFHRGNHASVAFIRMLMTSHKLFPKVDWERVEAGNYAVVDPVNPGAILYLSEQDYVIQVRVSLTTNRTLKVLAQPGDSPSTSTLDRDPTSQNSPPSTVTLLGHPWLRALLPRVGKGKRDGARGTRKSISYAFHSPFANPAWRVGSDEEAMIKIHGGNLLDWLRIWYNKCHFWVRGSLPSTVHVHERNSFGHQIRRLLVTRGLTHLILRMKIMLFVVNSYLGGVKLETTAPLGIRVRLTNGLPSILPLYARSAIRAGNLSYIRLWTTILNSYKGFKGLWDLPEIGTITQPHPVFDIERTPYYSEFLSFIMKFWDMLELQGANLHPDLSIKNLFWTSKAGPNHPHAVLGSALDALAWSKASTNLIIEWFKLTSQKDIMLEFRKISKMVVLEQSFYPALKPTFNKNGTIKKWVRADLSELILSRLHALYEPAGKVRIVAIVDYWTNAVLKPVHDWMFSILRLIPTDATFDQEGALRRFASKGYKTIYSLDLKAATDTIPMHLYIKLLEPVLGTAVTNLWKELLIDRDFLIPKELSEFNKNFLASVKRWWPTIGLYKDLSQDETRVRYTCGQPMGALSSWSSMAMIHHLLVQFSAHQCGYSGWFMDYLVLGDDIVIANKRVAVMYQAILAAFGIKIGLAKSFITENGMFNFANQTYIGFDNISPLSLKEELGITSLPARVELALRAVRRGWIDINQISWLSKVLKLFIAPGLYKEVQSSRNSRSEHPVVSWILSVLFLPGVPRLAPFGVGEVSINAFLTALKPEKAVLWNKPIKEISSSPVSEDTKMLVSKMLLRSADRLYAQFLEAREDLKGFGSWLTLSTPVSLKYVLNRIFTTTKESALTNWATDYRIFIKKLQILGQVGVPDAFLVEHTMDMYLNEVAQVVAEAEREFPLVPKFSKEDIMALLPRASTDDKSLANFIRIARLLGTIDDLDMPSTPHSTGGKRLLSHKQKIASGNGDHRCQS